MIGKLIIVTSIIVIFVVLITYQIEEFSNKNYTNTETMPLEYINFYSYLPYDIISKNKENKCGNMVNIILSLKNLRDNIIYNYKIIFIHFLIFYLIHKNQLKS